MGFFSRKPKNDAAKNDASAAEDSKVEKSPADDSEADKLPPFTITPLKRKKLQKLFEYGRANFAKGDNDYAIDMFSRAVQGDPGSLPYAQGLMEALDKKYNGKDKVAKGGGLAAAGPRSAMKKAVAKENWEDAAKAAVDLVAMNPDDTAALTSLATVCDEIAADEAQLYYLRRALSVNNKDPEINRICGKALGKMGQFDQAIICWHRVEKIDPDDEEATKAIADLTAEKTQLGGNVQRVRMRSGDVNEEGEQPEKAKPVEKEEEEVDEQELSREQRFKDAITKRPDDLTHYLDLGDYYVHEHRFDEARKLLTKALDISGPGDPRMRERLEEVDVRQLKHNLEIAEKKAAQEKTDEAKSLAKRLKVELNQRELEIFGSRCDRNPGNHAFQYEFGVRLKRAGKFKEAIQSLQEARGEGKYKASVHLELGECFQCIKQYSLALDNYEKAVASTAGQDKQKEIRKLALFRCGTLAMALAGSTLKSDTGGKHRDMVEKYVETAETRLTELAGLDYGYKDVADRLEKLGEIRNNL